MGVGAFASRQAIAGGSAAHAASLAVREQLLAVAARALKLHRTQLYRLMEKLGIARADSD